MMKILFLCHGNICRSPMAEFVMKEMTRRAGVEDVSVESAALHDDEIGNDIHFGTRSELRKHGVPFSPRAAWRLTAAKAREYDLLICMDARNLADLRHLVYPEDLPKIHLLLEFAGRSRDIADPWYTGDFEVTYDDVSEGCAGLLEHIRRPPERNSDP